MVVALGPGRFYGSALPRPRFFDDVTLNAERVDAPSSVLDPLLDWAREAHWSMGGHCFKRRRLQGRIEGSIQKLRAETEKALRARNKSPVTVKVGGKSSGPSKSGEKASESSRISEKLTGKSPKISKSGETTPKTSKNRVMSTKSSKSSKRKIRIEAESLDVEDDAEEENPVTPRVSSLEGGGITVSDAPERIKPTLNTRPRRRSARKLGDEFDRVATLSDREGIRDSAADAVLDAEKRLKGTVTAVGVSPRRSPRLR